MPVCDTDSTVETAVTDHALGAKTNCDTYVYSFSRDDLISRVRDLIDAYDSALARVQSAAAKSRKAMIEQVTKNTKESLRTIKWTHTLKQSLKNDAEIEFDETRIREVLYRPFTKLWLYEDHRIVSQARAVSNLFPRSEVLPPPPPPPPAEAVLISTPSNGAIFATLATRTVGDLKSAGIAAACRLIPRRRVMISSSSNMAFQALATDTLPDVAAVKGSQQTRVMPRLKQS